MGYLLAFAIGLTVLCVWFFDIHGPAEYREKCIQSGGQVAHSSGGYDFCVDKNGKMVTW